MPKSIKGFFSVIGPRSFQIILQHFVQFEALLVIEILWALEKAIPGVLEHWFIAIVVQSF